MNLAWEQPYLRKIFLSTILFVLIAGMFFRFTHITDNEFVFFDEGFYLNYNRSLGEVLATEFPDTFHDLSQAFYTLVKMCLSSGKSLWFFIVDMRYFFGGTYDWYVSKLAAALTGTITLYVVYFFARSYYQSSWIAWLSVALLAILPSHVFYSRIGLQEALSTLLVLCGFVFYLFPRSFSWKTFLSGVICAAAFFANYRLIIFPVLMGFCELWTAFTEQYKINETNSGTGKSAITVSLFLNLREKFHFRKYTWWTLTFLCCVFLVGNIDHGRNTTVTFAWMFHQAHLAEKQFDFINLFSYPYYIFRLENFLFAIFFFGNGYLFIKYRGSFQLPFLLVCLQMFIFSFTSDKGARYLCVVTPFMAMTVAYCIEKLFQLLKQDYFRLGLLALSGMMVLLMCQKSYAISRIPSDYREATEYLLNIRPDVKFISTQPYVQSLYVADRENVKPCPQKFQSLVIYYSQGYRYLVVGPQAYISWAKDNEKFHLELEGYLGFIKRAVTPIKTYPHFNDIMMERFVFEHSENLRRSVAFLREARSSGFGELRIYDLSQSISKILSALSVPFVLYDG